MKNKIVVTAFAIFTSAIFMISGCKKENTPPTIVLHGDAHMTSYKGDTFTDPGVTATDGEDGDLTSKVQVDGTVGTAPNIYTLTYSVTDKEGNYASVQRYVTVGYKSTSLAGTYNVTETSPYGTVNYTGSVTADSVDLSHFVFGSLSTSNPIVVDAKIVDRDQIDMITDVQGGPISQFTGNITEPSSAITFNFTYLRPIGSNITNCTATWVKQ